MKPLVLASLLVGSLAVPLQAQAQQSTAGVPPLEFNGLYFDPPVQDYYVAREPGRAPSVRPAPGQFGWRGPSYGPGIDTFDANAPR